MQALAKVHAVRLVQYLPLILDYVFHCMCTTPTLAHQAFLAMQDIITRVHELADRQVPDLLGAYVDNVFRLSKGVGAFLHEALTEQWFQLARNGVRGARRATRFFSLATYTRELIDYCRSSRTITSSSTVGSSSVSSISQWFSSWSKLESLVRVHAFSCDSRCC